MSLDRQSVQHQPLNVKVDFHATAPSESSSRIPSAPSVPSLNPTGVTLLGPVSFVSFNEKSASLMNRPSLRNSDRAASRISGIVTFEFDLAARNAALRATF